MMNNADSTERPIDVWTADRDQPVSRTNVYVVRPAARGEGFDLISTALATGRLHFGKKHVAVGYATLHSGSHASLIRVYDAAGRLTATHERAAARRGSAE